MPDFHTIDVTKIEPGRKHAVIFETFDALDEGSSIIIHNDHDPKGLYYELFAKRANGFTWAYLKSGPEEWSVEIHKTPAVQDVETIGEMVKKDMRKAEVFAKHGIDYCCGGKRSLEDACREKNLDVSVLKNELENILSHGAPSHDFDAWDLSFLCDYIVNVHHAYVRKASAPLADLAHKVADHHGKTNAELYPVSAVADRLIAELAMHMRKEEVILFPYIKQLEKNEDTENMNEIFHSISQPISVMEHDHNLVHDMLDELKTLTHNYTPPENSCNSYKLLFNKLKEFEDDLHIHIHLENNILFPKAIEYNKCLNA
jgi:regulator of cell morphogenesis and NO signaling